MELGELQELGKYEGTKLRNGNGKCKYGKGNQALFNGKSRELRIYSLERHFQLLLLIFQITNSTFGSKLQCGANT